MLTFSLCNFYYELDGGLDLSSLLYWSARNVKMSATGHSFLVYLNGEFFKNHFFHFMAPLDQRIKIAMSVGAKLLFWKNKTRGERALLRITQVLKQLPEQNSPHFTHFSRPFSGQPQKEEQFTRNSAAGPALLTPRPSHYPAPFALPGPATCQPRGRHGRGGVGEVAPGRDAGDRGLPGGLRSAFGPLRSAVAPLQPPGGSGPHRVSGAPPADSQGPCGRRPQPHPHNLGAAGRYAPSPAAVRQRVRCGARLTC